MAPCKILNGGISAKSRAIHFMLRFYGRVFRAPMHPYYITRIAWSSLR